jgi:hypothetical protein
MKMWLKIWAKKWTSTQKFNNRLCSKLDMPIKRTKKTKELCFRFPNAELGMLFYGTIALILHLISLYMTIRRLKQVISAELIKFSIKSYANPNDIPHSDIKSFLAENFLAPIVSIFASVIFAFMFACCILFKAGNLGNDDKQLGVDLILIDGSCPINGLENSSENLSSSNLNTKEKEDTEKSSPSQVQSSPSSSISSMSSSRSISSPFTETRENNDFINNKINVMPKTITTKSLDPFGTSFLTKKNPYFHNLSKKSKVKFFYLPAFNSCFHLIMCLSLLITKLLLNHFETSAYSISNANIENKLNHGHNDLNSIKLIRYFYMNRNNTQAIDHLFRELNEKIILNKNLNLGPANSTSKMLKVSNKFQIDFNYINYSLAFLVLTLKFTRVYSKMNMFYAFLVFLHLLFFTLLNLTMYPALEILFKNSLNSTNKSTSDSSILDTLKNENYISNSNLYKLVPSSFESQKFMLITYIASWLLNLIYLTSINVFGTSFYKDAQLKIKCKFESYLNYYGANESNANALDEVGKKSIYDNNIVNPFLESNYAKSIVLYHGNDDGGSGTKQYKAIIAGIFLLLITEAIRVPFIYSCYIKYFIYSFDTYLLALMFQLVYLLYNAIFWIILSFKKEWIVRFTPQFRVLLWHQLYSQHLKRNRKLFLNDEQANLSRNSSSSQTLSTDMSKYEATFEEASTRLNGLLVNSNRILLCRF